MILTVTTPNGRSVDVDTEENPHTCIIDDSFTCIACVAQSLVGQSDKAPSELLTDDKFAELNPAGYADMADKALTAGLTDAERGAADALAERITRPRPNAFYPLFATCKVCKASLQFDIDPDGTPGQNGDWGADGDYGCITGDDEGCDGHTPVNIRWEPKEENT